MLNKYWVSLEFGRYSDPNLEEFGGYVAASLASNPAFPNPPIEPAELRTRVAAFHSRILAAGLGGLQHVAARNIARENVLAALRKNAGYVQTVASSDLDTLLSSGFYVESPAGARAQSKKPVILLLDELATARTLLRVHPFSDARTYHVQIGRAGRWSGSGGYAHANRITPLN